MAIPSDFIDLSQSKFETRIKRSRTRTIEWLIAVMFIVTLLIGSGVFLKVSNAADYRVNGKGLPQDNVQRISPGTLGTIVVNNKLQQLPARQLMEDETDSSCELKT